MYRKIWEFEKRLCVANGKEPFILLKSASFLLMFNKRASSGSLCANAYLYVIA